METETHFVDIENHIFRTKIDLFKHSDQIVGFKVMCWERVIECQLDEDHKPIFNVRKLEMEDKPLILREGYRRVGQQWSDEDIEDIKQLFVSEDENINKISKKMERTEKGVRLRLRSMGLIDGNDQTIIPPKKKVKN